MLDLIIRNGWVADGTGNPAYPADVAVEGDRIAGVGRLSHAHATRVIDAAGKIVCPGFIDSHSHSDSTILMNPLAQSTIRQGVTTEIVGNCGHSPAPLTDLNKGPHGQDLLGVGRQIQESWSSYADYLQVIEEMGTSENLAWFVGHNTLRGAVGIVGDRVSEDQMKGMIKLLRESMDAGAMGLSTGLEFEPGRWASTDEIVQLAKVVGEYDGYYASHIRNRAKFLQPAIDEFMEIVRSSGVHGQVSHLNVRYNTGAPEGAWERAVQTMETVRAQGFDVAADCTPLQDGTGGPAAILPPWINEEGPLRAAELLSDPEVRARVRTDCDRYWAFIQRGDWHRIRILGSNRHPEIVGKNFNEIAELWNKDQWDCLFDLFVESFRGEGRVRYIGRLFTEEHVIGYITHPLFNLSVDATTATIDGPPGTLFSHPLHYSGMVHYLTHWVREKHVLRLEEAIRKMTSMPATRFGLRDRGILRTGAYADVVVFDFDALDNGSTDEHPLQYCRGVSDVLVNGEAVIKAGEHTGARPGRNLQYQ
ncbi:MAG: D-aminoacylase [Anaerolineae bacterium]|nr:D-aminoacylase [Anaerolineae bacterium]